MKCLSLIINQKKTVCDLRTTRQKSYKKCSDELKFLPIVVFFTKSLVVSATFISFHFGTISEKVDLM